MEIKNIAVIGAGAIGSYFITGLQQKEDISLCVVAEGERRSRLQEQGICVNGKKVTLEVKTPEEAAGADLIIVAVKYGGLQGCLPMLDKMVKEHTIVMSPLNGIDSEEIIGAHIGREHMIWSMIKIASQRRENEICFDPDVTIGVYFGEIEKRKSERIEALDRLFAHSGVHYQVSEDIQKDIWYKFGLNISRNIPQAIINCGVGGYESSSNLAYLGDRMLDEVIAVAEQKGIDIHDAAEQPGMHIAISPDSRFSTLQDLDAGRQTEIEMFCGALNRMGKELGIATPYNDFAYHAIKCLEEKNMGLLK